MEKGEVNGEGGGDASPTSALFTHIFNEILLESTLLKQILAVPPPYRPEHGCLARRYIL
jgi:hypothetical protein